MSARLVLRPLVLILAALCLTLATSVAKQPAAIALRDTNGAWQRPLQSDKRAVVLFFIARDCPISNGYAPEINRIATSSREKTSHFTLFIQTPVCPWPQRVNMQKTTYKFPLCSTLRHQWST
jgi:hypothetical protein